MAGATNPGAGNALGRFSRASRTSLVATRSRQVDGLDENSRRLEMQAIGGGADGASGRLLGIKATNTTALNAGITVGKMLSISIQPRDLLEAAAEIITR